MGRTGHESQHIPGHKELLIEEESFFVKAITCTFLDKNIKYPLLL